MITVKNMIRLVAILLAFQQYAFTQSNAIADSLIIYDWRLKANKPGKPDFKIGVDSELRQRDWINNLGDNMEMEYKGDHHIPRLSRWGGQIIF